jgi:hypothetical protein
MVLQSSSASLCFYGIAAVECVALLVISLVFQYMQFAW